MNPVPLMAFSTHACQRKSLTITPMPPGSAKSPYACQSPPWRQICTKSAPSLHQVCTRSGPKPAPESTPHANAGHAIGAEHPARLRGLTWPEFRTMHTAGAVFTTVLRALTPLYAGLITPEPVSDWHADVPQEDGRSLQFETNCAPGIAKMPASRRARVLAHFLQCRSQIAATNARSCSREDATETTPCFPASSDTPAIAHRSTR